MDLSTITNIVTPEGEVSKITCKNINLPDEYQEVEYIQAKGGAYIDLGFSFDTAAIIKLGIYLSSTLGVSAYPFGAAEDNGKYRCMITAPYDGGAYIYGYGSTGSTYQPVRVNGTKNSLNEVEYTINSGKISVFVKPSGSSFIKTSISYTMTSNMYLFAQNYNGSVRWGGTRQIHYFKYYDKTDTLICDLVPCYRKSDGTIGMYDIERGIFLTNVGTGSFRKGLDVALWRFNLIPFISTEEDGITIYNGGLGYKNGYRVRSGGAEAGANSAVCTGFIPFSKEDKLYIYPPFNGGNVQNAINFYNNSYEVLGQVTDSGAQYGICNETFKTQVINGVSVLDLSAVTVTGVNDIAYVRVTNAILDVDSIISLMSDGSEMIITKNEELIL